MPRIHILNQDTVNQIAAGEVIERPMAVVKELVENAIDAGASSITVEIKDGGKNLIRITDNGMGMEQEDVVLAFTPHATSKIDSVQDLMQVSTLGFRGEALASIAAVSQLEMITKTRQSLMGYRYLVDGGEEKGLESVGCPEGTTFLVRNLFYNTPARLKFLKTSATEAGYINSLLERMALSHPDISFRFINQNQPKLQTSGNGNLKDVIYHIYGREITSQLLDVDTGEVNCSVKGFLGKPVISRGNRNFMNYFINGRYIKSNIIHKAIEDAYQPYSMQHRYPFTVLHFTIEPEMVDINVHPQKMEIRFTDSQGIYQSVYHAISQALKHREYIPEVILTPRKEEKKVFTAETLPKQNVPKAGQTVKENLPTDKVVLPKQPVSKDADSSVPQKGQTQALVQHQEITPEQMQSLTLEQPQALVPEETPGQAQKTKQESSQDFLRENPSYGTTQEKTPEKIVGAKTGTESPVTTVPRQENLFEQGILSEKASRKVVIVGQVFDTYWILEYDNAMYLVDQHAAHEKVLYERFMKQMKEQETATQLLQPPVILTLTLQEQSLVQEHMDIFKKLGYQMEPFGGREYAVTGVPAHLPQVGEERLLREVIDTLSDSHSAKTPDILLDKVASMSCKAAVKGNNHLHREQMEELLCELMTLENPYHCPHGRPTMIKMTKQELEKKFKRIL